MPRLPLKLSLLFICLGLLLGLTPAARAQDTEDALFNACRVGDLETVQKLAAQGINLSSQQPPQNYSPLMYAVMRHHKPLIAFLLSKNIPLDQANLQGQTALLLAASGGQDDLVEWLHGAGGDINHQEENGYSPLMWAAYWGHESVISYLTQQRIQIDLKNKDGYTALMFAVLGGQAHLVVEKARNAAQKHQSGRHYYVDVPPNDIAIVNALLKAGANPNLQNDQGQTPLMLAVEKKSVQLILRLRKAGARLDLKDKQNLTALDYAKSLPHLSAALVSPL